MSRSRIIKDIEWSSVLPDLPISLDRAWAIGNPVINSSVNSNRMLIVYVVTESASIPAETVIDIQINGVSGTLIGNQVEVQEFYSNIIAIFRWSDSQLTSMPTNPSVNITWSNGGSDFGEFQLMSAIYSNVDQTSPVVDTKTGIDTDNPATFNTSIITENEGVILAGYVSGNGFSNPSSTELGYINQVYYNGSSASGAVFTKDSVGSSDAIGLSILNTNRNAYNCIVLRKA